MKLIRHIKASFCNFNKHEFNKTKLTKLDNRSLLILNGPDSAKLLQGLMTNDVRGIKQVSIGQQKLQRVALYTLFLQPKGKVVTDAFVFRPRQYIGGKAVYSKEELWIDVPTQTKSFLKQHLRRHMWKKQVELHDVQTGDEEYKPTIYSGYVITVICQNQGAPTMQMLLGGSVELEEQEKGQDGTYANLIFFDPRGKDFGMRIISMQPQLDIQGHFEVLPQKEQERLFQKLGQVPIQHSGNKLPFQFNYDLMNAISLKKGCFLGQEIVSRGLLAGIVRRRAFPYVLRDNNQIIPTGSIIKSNEEQLGKVLFSSEGQGTALINYINLLQKGVKWPFKFDSPFAGQILNPFEEKLNKYYSEIKDKQKILEDLQL